MKRSFVDLRIAPKKETGGNLEAGFEFLKVCGEGTSRLLRSLFAASLGV